ncbi:MAG: hypothetical protein LBB76_01830 [Azoarcus sp.]|jgi:hypothetical protein|nr:hypothetical protein [Azoarcus sp.]
MSRKDADTANETELSAGWPLAWWSPWASLENWSVLWQEPLRAWAESMARLPAAWMPALAEERAGQPSSIDFFLPWLPRIDARIEALDGHDNEDALRVMLRAALPGSLGGDYLEVDAKVRRSHGSPILEATGGKAEKVGTQSRAKALPESDDRQVWVAPDKK